MTEEHHAPVPASCSCALLSTSSVQDVLHIVWITQNVGTIPCDIISDELRNIYPLYDALPLWVYSNRALPEWSSPLLIKQVAGPKLILHNNYPASLVHCCCRGHVLEIGRYLPGLTTSSIPDRLVDNWMLRFAQPERCAGASANLWMVWTFLFLPQFENPGMSTSKFFIQCVR